MHRILYTENYKMPMREIKEDPDQTLCSHIGTLNITRMLMSPRQVCRFNVVPVKVPVGMFIDINKLILRFS